MAVEIGADRKTEAEEAQLRVLADGRRAAALAINVQPRAAGDRGDRPSDRAGVELFEAVADGVGRAHHHRLRELARVVVEDAVALEIDGRDGQRRREANLEFAERRSSQPTGRTGSRLVG